jgi:hypothetical protein
MQQDEPKMLTSNEYAVISHRLRLIAAMIRESGPLDDFIEAISAWEQPATAPEMGRLAAYLNDARPLALGFLDAYSNWSRSRVRRNK